MITKTQYDLAYYLLLDYYGRRDVKEHWPKFRNEIKEHGLDEDAWKNLAEYNETGPEWVRMVNDGY